MTEKGDAQHTHPFRHSKVQKLVGLLLLFTPFATGGPDAVRAQTPWETIAPFSQPPAEFAERYGDYRSPLRFDDGKRVSSPGQWPRRRKEIAQWWDEVMGPWPPLIEHPQMEVLSVTPRENFQQRRV